MQLINHPLPKGKIIKMSDQDATDRDRRKREYNRLAQRDFRRRRKEHLKNLEQLQREQSSEQTEELEQLRAENDQLKHENERLRAQLFGPSSSTGFSAPGQIPSSSAAQSARSFSTSPTGSSTYENPFQPGAGQLMPRPGPSSHMPASGMNLAPGSLEVLPVSPHSSPGEAQPPVCLPGAYPGVSQSIEPESMMGVHTYDPRLVVVAPCDKAKARTYLRDLFHPLLSNPSILTAPMDHLAALAALAESLPRPLKPTKTQLETPHPVGIDLIPSPMLRDRLINFDPSVARGFVDEVLASLINDPSLSAAAGADYGQLVIWGEDALNESAWEFSQDTLQRWGWLLGREWVQRANFWRRQREDELLPEW